MKRFLALMLCLCFALGGCAQSADAPRPAEGGVLPMPEPVASVPVPAADAPDGAADFDSLALRLAALPQLPEQPDESALWEAMNGKSAEEQNKLWDDFSRRQAAYYDAVRALRGDGVEAMLTPSFAAYTLQTAQQLLRGASEENAVYSPANLYLALCMLAETTGGTTRAQLLDLLGLADAEQARAASDSLWRALYNDSGTGKTLLANSLWLNDALDFRQETVDVLADAYHASTFRAPMGDKATDEAVRAWINENTNHLLENAAGALQTDPDTLLLLISTLYFKGTWADQFETFLTREDVFTAANGAEQKAEFMHQSKKGAYYRGAGFTAAPLPFLDGTSMWFLLPDEGVSLESLWALVQDLPTLAVDTSEGCYELRDYASLARQGYGEIHWSVPKFDVDSDLDLIPALEALGVTDAFTDAADFSPLTGLDALVSAVKHAARVKVDEEGCEAAAFTAVMAEATSALVEPLPVVEMDLDRPFGFLITGAEGLPLFAGVVNTLE